MTEKTVVAQLHTCTCRHKNHTYFHSMWAHLMDHIFPLCVHGKKLPPLTVWKRNSLIKKRPEPRCLAVPSIFRKIGKKEISHTKKINEPKRTPGGTRGQVVFPPFTPFAISSLNFQNDWSKSSWFFLLPLPCTSFLLWVSSQQEPNEDFSLQNDVAWPSLSWFSYSAV